MPAHMIPKTDMTKEDAPRPLTAEEQEALVKPKLLNLVACFGPKHAPKAKPVEAKPVNNGWGKDKLGEAVDWSKQDQDTSQRRTSGKRKKDSGKR